MTHFERKNLARVLTVIMELDAAIEDLSIHVAADGLCRVTFTLREGESLPDLPGIPDTEP